MNKPVKYSKLTLCIKSQDVEVVAYITLECKSKRGTFFFFFFGCKSKKKND